MQKLRFYSIFLYMKLVIVKHKLKPSILGGFSFFYFAIFDEKKSLLVFI